VRTHFQEGLRWAVENEVFEQALHTGKVQHPSPELKLNNCLSHKVKCNANRDSKHQLRR
jgi:hypothetical protein